MTTPIADFLARYAEKDPIRLHMPGHKGRLPGTAHDLTEVTGADSLYEADGIIAESEANASALFGAHTLYSTEGSSHAIRAMLYLLLTAARAEGRTPTVLAGRNAHKSFLSAVALLDIPVSWLWPRPEDSYLACTVEPEALRERFRREGAPFALYLTAPDYLGHMPDLRAIAAVCREAGVLLAVDNAHGAYLRFLPTSRHPIDLGATVVCDSAHKTLPCLTGAAYLHIAKGAPQSMHEGAKAALALFGSTSPSYPILASLDRANRILAEGYREELAALLPRLSAMRARLEAHGYTLVGDEPLKLTVAARPFGYTGTALYERLYERSLVAEFADPDYLVAMLTPSLHDAELAALLEALLAIPPRAPLGGEALPLLPPRVRMSPREALLAPAEVIPVEAALGRTLAAATVGCPPAVPILVSGEVVDERALSLFAYYGVERLRVVREPSPERKADHEGA